jgi:hypothetical protein
MCYIKLPKKSSIYNYLNFFYYIYKRNNWMLDFSRFWKDFEDVKIDRPVFLLGFHGGGTTLLSRIIRRNKDFVSVTGNYKYWSGADEMQNVLGPILSPELTGIKYKIPAESGLKFPTHWLYATNKYLSYFRNVQKDVTPEIKERFRKTIRWLIARNAIDKNKVRFTDKSQIYTIKVSFINEILKDTKPKFILVLRNPYVLCHRIVNRSPNCFKNNNIKSKEEQLEIASQHWVNSIKCAMKDAKKVDLMIVRFEDVLNQPEKIIRKVCDFIEIEFDKDMIPQSEHKILLGTLGPNKWYPLRPNINERYFKEMEKEEIEIIDNNVRKYAEKFSYSRP